MRLKSFYGSTMTEAMSLVREALGDEAIIVATRNDEDTNGVRITAAIEEKPVAAPEYTSSAYLDDDASDSIEIISNALVHHHVPSVLAEKLLATATQYASEDILLALGAAMDTHIHYAPIEEEQKQPMILIGPPGAGKTLCVAKLATKATLEKRKAALISTDTDRAGGMAQLSAFARILNNDILEIEDPYTLQDAITMQPQGTITLIDTAGCNPFSIVEKQNLTALLKNTQAEPCLVLPADMDSEVALEMANEFATLGAKRIIVTRLDMTRKMGNLLKTAYESGLPLCAFSTTGKVTEKLMPFNPVSLARLFLPTEQLTPRKTANGIAQ